METGITTPTEPRSEMMVAAILALRPYLDEDGTIPSWDYQEAIRAALTLHSKRFLNAPNYPPKVEIKLAQSD